jgi:glycosyltransferase involved in cell wall biosynthesis
MQRFRILHTLPDLALGGGQVITLRHLTHRDAERFDVGVVYLHPPTELFDAFAETGATLHTLQRSPTARTARTAMVWDLVRLLRRERIDLLHVHGPSDRKLGLTAAWLARVPAVCQIHSEYVHFGPMLPVHPTAAQRARATVTAWLRDGIEARTVKEYVADSSAAADLFRPLIRQPVTAMALSLPFDAYAAADDIDRRAARADLGIGDEPMLLCVSRLVDGKGQERLISLMPRVLAHRPDAVLVLVGDGDRRAAFEARADALGVADRVRFLGNRYDVPVLLRLADVFVFGSRTEGLGVAVAEAMGARLPVVAFRLPALDTYCTEGVTGFYPAQTDDDGFVDAVCRLIDAPDLAVGMGAAGHRAVAARFHPRATADTFETAYRRILEPGYVADEPAAAPAPDDVPSADGAANPLSLTRAKG